MRVRADAKAATSSLVSVQGVMIDYLCTTALLRTLGLSSVSMVRRHARLAMLYTCTRRWATTTSLEVGDRQVCPWACVLAVGEQGAACHEALHS